jgi:hypothetical protein
MIFILTFFRTVRTSGATVAELRNSYKPAISLSSLQDANAFGRSCFWYDAWLVRHP